MGRAIPLSFGIIHNQRSVMGLDDLVSFISLCNGREKLPKVENQGFLIFDSEAVSITQLLSKVLQALNHHSLLAIKFWLMPIPILIMTF
jgi:hypothetical protein